MQPLFHLTLKSTKLEQDLQMCKTNIRLVQPVLITSCGKTRRTFSLFQGYPVRRQGQHDWQVGRRTGEGGQYRFAGNPDIEFECSEAAIQDAALPDQGVLCRRLSLKMREAKRCITYFMTQFLKRERTRVRQRAHIRAWEQLQVVRLSAGSLLLFTFTGHNFQRTHSLVSTSELRGIRVYPISKQLSAAKSKTISYNKTKTTTRTGSK